MAKIRTPKIHQAAFDDPSAREVGYSFLTGGTQRSDFGSTRRSYRSAQRATAKANDAHALVVGTWRELVTLESEHHVDEFAPAVTPRLNGAISTGAVLVEFGLGAWLGWSLGGGDDPFLSGFAYVGPAVSAFGFGGVFGLAGLALAEGLGRSLGRYLGRADSTNLRPDEEGLSQERREGGIVSRWRVGALSWITALALVGVGGYFVANTLRESLVETASIDVSPTAIAALGTIIPVGASVVKAHWYSREAAVRHHELAQMFAALVKRWSRKHARAEKRRADTAARFTHIIAAAALADANQNGNSAARVEMLIDERMPMTELLSAEFPRDLGDTATEPPTLKKAA